MKSEYGFELDNSIVSMLKFPDFGNYCSYVRQYPCSWKYIPRFLGTKRHHIYNSFSSGSERNYRDFPGCPVVKNLPSNAGDMGLIPGWGTKIPHAAGQLSPHATTREAHMPQ